MDQGLISFLDTTQWIQQEAKEGIADIKWHDL